MLSWMQIWWQMSQSWNFLRHAYACGWSLYGDVSNGWSHRRYAMAFTVAQVTPIVPVRRVRF